MSLSLSFHAISYDTAKQVFPNATATGAGAGAWRQSWQVAMRSRFKTSVRRSSSNDQVQITDSKDWFE